VAPDARSQIINSLPAQRHLARRPLAEALAGNPELVLGHDRERALPHGAERCGIVYRLVDIQEQHAPDLGRFVLASHLFRTEAFVCPSLALVFELLHVVAHGVDEIVGQLSVALPGVAEQVQVRLRGLEATQVVDGVGLV